MDYEDMTIDQLYGALKKATAATVAEFTTYVGILHELWRRGETHPLMKQGPARWHKEIAAKRLSPTLALTIGGGHTALVRKMLDLPLDKQDALASGETIVVAVHNEEGKIVAADQTITDLDGWMYEIVFNDGMIRSFNQQKKLLSNRSPDVRRSRVPTEIKADPAAGEIVWGQQRAKPADFTKAFRDLGFKAPEREDRRPGEPIR